MTRRSAVPVLLALALALALLACGGGKDGAAAVGTVTKVVGAVTVRRGAGPAEPAREGLEVLRDMTFVTGAGASLEVRFTNNYVWTLGESRERAVAALRVVDLPKVEAVTAVADEGGERTSAAGRHAEPSAADTAATAMKDQRTEAAPADEATGGPRAFAEAPEKAMTPEVPTVVEDPAGAAPTMAPPPPAEPPPPPPKPEAAKKKRGAPLDGKRGGGSGDIDELLDGAGGGGSLRAPGGGGGGGLPEQLSREQVQTGLKGALPAIKACASKHGASGTLTMEIVIAGEGRVVKATAQGAHGGSELEACAFAALRAASFPRFSGKPMAIRYPFKLN